MAALLVALLASGLIVAVALWRGSLTPSGAAGALLVGTLIVGFGGWVWAVLLGLFFISSSLLSHFREVEKQNLAEKFEKGHRRDWGQVLANGGLGSFVAVLNGVTPAVGWFVFFVGVMASVTADTWATELGTLAEQPPRLITTGRRVDVGTSGGISLLGTAVSLAGALLIGTAAGLLSSQVSLQAAAILGTLAGLAGSLFDSFLGATVQRIYFCNACQKETERKIHRCGHTTRPQRGWYWLNNDRVNLIASAAGGLVAVGLWLVFG